MGSRGVYRNGGGSSRRATISPTDEDDQQDEREGDKEREPVAKIPTLRSTIVRMNEDDNDKEEEKGGREKLSGDERSERQQRQGRGPGSPGSSHRADREEEHGEGESEEDFPRCSYRESNVRGSETAAGGKARNHHHCCSERRDTTPDRAGGGGWGRGSRDHRDRNDEGGFFRDSGRGGPRDIDRDRDIAGMLQGRSPRSPRSPLRSPRRNWRERGDHGGGFQMDSCPPPQQREGNCDEDGGIGNAAAKYCGGDQGGKRKRGSIESPPLGGSMRGVSSQAHYQRDRGWRERGSGGGGGGDSRSVNHAHDRSSYHPITSRTESAAPRRRGGDDSPSSVNSRGREMVAGDGTCNSRAAGGQQQQRDSYDSRPRRRDVRRERGERGGSGDDFRGRGDRKREPIDGAGDGERERGGALPDLYSVQKGTVHSVRPFGIFVRMNGYRNHGLVHLSQISDHEVTSRSDSDAAKVEAISAIVGDGDHVWVKVISVKTEDDGSVKVGCSLKYVSQGDGRDLDPNNLQLQRLQSSKYGAWQAPKKLELDAVYNVVCTRCGGHGHMKKDCYSTGEKTYALSKDEGDDEERNREQERGGGGRREGRGGAGAGSSSSKVGAAGVAKDSIEGDPSLRPPSGPRGRGRAMVQPAWMKYGVGPWLSVGARGSNGQREKGGAPPTLESFSEEVTTLEEAMAILRKAKKDKRRRKDERRQHSRRSDSSRREKRHGGKEGRRGKHKKRRRGGDRGPADYEDSDHWHQKSRKRQRT